MTGVQVGDDGNGVIVCVTDSDCALYHNSINIPYICSKMMLSPFYDTIQFDTLGWSVLNVYIVVTNEGWT